MPIIARTTADKQQDWRLILAHSLKTGAAIRDYLNLPEPESAKQQLDQQAADDFPVLVPQPFLDLAKRGDPNDPITRQVLPNGQEMLPQPGYVTDPLGEIPSNIRPGIIHKYHGRALLLAATGCAINCRYCFRRHFDYADNRISQKQWQTSLEYVRADTSLREIILSGGDPLMLQDNALSALITELEHIPHLQRLRIHSRLPVVIPQRLTPELLDTLTRTRLQVTLVLHINHANEIGQPLQRYLAPWVVSPITLLNQSVLLAGINDDVDTLTQLSESLFAVGVLPYYLHVLDKVQGAQHFDIPTQQAISLFEQLHARLPGYLVPRLTKEEEGKAGKTVLSSQR